MASLILNMVASALGAAGGVAVAVTLMRRRSQIHRSLPTRRASYTGPSAEPYIELGQQILSERRSRRARPGRWSR